MKASLPPPWKGSQAYGWEKGGAELATTLSYVAYKKQSLMPYVLQKTSFQNMETGPTSLTLRDAGMPLNSTEGLERKIILQQKAQCEFSFAP